MYKRSRKGWTKHLDFIVLDLICLVFCFSLSVYFRLGSWYSLFNNFLFRTVLAILLVIDLLVIVLSDSYHNVVRRSWYVELGQTVKQDLLVFAAVTVYLYTVKDAREFSRLILWMTMGMHMVVRFAVSCLWKRHLHASQKISSHSILLIADQRTVKSIIERFHDQPGSMFNVTGIVLADVDATGHEISGIPVVSSLKDASMYICREWIDEVYIASFRDNGHLSANSALTTISGDIEELVNRCNEMGVTVHQEIGSEGGENRIIQKLAGRYVVTTTMKLATPMQLLLKRALDIVGGLVGSLIALLVIAIVGPKIKKESPGPILFKQERIGQNGKHITIYKLRSMYMDAEERKAELMKDNRVSDGMMFKIEFDPRVIGNEVLPDGTTKTGIGEFIRKTSLDEFPQFFCVLRGTMSLVGTRPPTLDEWEKYAYHHRARLSIKPGITGMWQVSGRSKVTDFEEVVKLDTEYINNWNIGLDIKILFKTVVSVLKGDGAM